MTTSPSDAPATPRSAEREQFLRDVFTTALEGGIGYWARFMSYRNRDGEPFGATVRECDDDECRDLVIDAEIIERGLQGLADGTVTFGGSPMSASAHRFWAGMLAVPDAGEIDADDADEIVQAGLFGDVRYG